MANDGTVKIGTELDEKGLKDGLSGIGSFAEKGFGVLKTSAEVAAKAVAGVSAALGAGVTAAIKVGSSFESEMSKVAAISGATGDDLAALTQKAKDMGASTMFSASESAEAMEYMAMAGWKTTDMLNGIEGIMNLAAASGEDLATTSDIVTDALTAFGLAAEDSTHFADILASASSNANTNVSMMGETFKYVAPVAGALGYSAEDAAVAIGLMANSGIKASQAGTSLRSIMSRLAKPTDEVQAAMDRLGISMTNSDGSMKSLDEIMVDLREGFSGLSEAESASVAASLAGQEAMSGLLAIVSASDDDFNKLKDSIYNCDGASAQMAETMQDNLQGKLTILKSAAEGLGIVIYESIEEPLKNLADSGQEALTKLTDAFKTGGTEGLIEAGMQILNDVLLGIVQAAPEIIDTAINLINSFITNLDANLPQILSAGGKILSTLIGGMVELFPSLANLAYDLITNLLTAITENSDSMVQGGADTLVSFINGCTEKIPDLLSMAVNAVIAMAMSLTDPNTLSNIVNAGIELLVSLVTGITDAIPRLIAAVPTIVANLVTAIIANIPRLLVAAAEVMLQLGKYLINNISNMLLAVPRLFKGLFDAFIGMDWGSIGHNIIEGIKEGILNAAKNLVDSAVQAAKSALDAVKDFLGIHSPSRVMRDVIGKNMIAGINVGIEEETPGLEKHSKASMQSAINAMKKTSAEKFVIEMQQKARLISNDSAEGEAAKYEGNEPDEKGTSQEPIDYERMGVEMKKAMNGMPVVLQGKKVGRLIAQTVNDEIGRINERKT